MAKYQSGNATKKRILCKAEELFYQIGYEQTTVDQINILSETTKSSFYHHYTNKLELGKLVYESFCTNNSKISDLFLDQINDIERFFLEIRSFWYLLLKDEHLKQFAIDLSNENILIYPNNNYIFKTCSVLSFHKISDNEMQFIEMAHKGVFKQLLHDTLHKLNQYDYDLTSDYYLYFLFTLFEVEESIFQNLLLKSKSLFSECSIKNDAFNVIFSLK